jgi:hypothetical protein
MRRILVIGTVAAVVLAAGVAGVVAFRPSPTHEGGLHRAESVAAAVAAHGASQPQRRQIAVTTLTYFKVVLTVTRGGPGHRFQGTLTATGYQHSGHHWKLIAAKRIGKVSGWAWFAVDTCSLTTTQYKNNVKPSPPVIPSDSIKVSLLIDPAIGCSRSYSKNWRP